MTRDKFIEKLTKKLMKRMPDLAKYPEQSEQLVNLVIKLAEKQGMYYSPIEDYGDYKIRTVRGWDE